MSPDDLTTIGSQIENAVDVLREQFKIEHLEMDLVYGNDEQTALRVTIDRGGDPQIFFVAQD